MTTAKGSENATTTATRGASAPRPRILFSSAGSMNLFVRELRSAGGAAGLPITFEATFPLRLNAGPIEAAPNAAGGCVLAITPEFIDSLRSMPNEEKGRPSVGWRRILSTEGLEIELEPVGQAMHRLVKAIEAMGNYGLRFAFLDDKTAAERILGRLRQQATAEAQVQEEALVVLGQQVGIAGDGVPLDQVMAAEKAAAARARAAQPTRTPTRPRR